MLLLHFVVNILRLNITYYCLFPVCQNFVRKEDPLKPDAAVIQVRSLLCRLVIIILLYNPGLQMVMLTGTSLVSVDVRYQDCDL